MEITFLGSRWFYLRPQKHPRCGLTYFVSKSTTCKFIIYVYVYVRKKLASFFLQGSHWNPYYIYIYIHSYGIYIYIFFISWNIDPCQNRNRITVTCFYVRSQNRKFRILAPSETCFVTGLKFQSWMVHWVP